MDGCANYNKNNIYIFIIMNNSNDLTTSLLQSSESSMPDIMSTASSTSDGEGFFESIKNISVTTWL
jgi:hypothetical protein